MGSWIPGIIGFFLGRKVGSTEPKTLLAICITLEVLTLVFCFTGNPIGGITSFVEALLIVPLGIQYGGGVIACLICAFFQFFFVLGMLVVPGNVLSYCCAHLISLIYPVYKIWRSYS